VPRQGQSRDSHETFLLESRRQERQFALVSGSCGTYNKHNAGGEFFGRGMDRPQAMTLRPRPGGGIEAEIVRSRSPAPRLAVVMDYLWFDGKPLFLPQDILVPLENRALNLDDFSMGGRPALPMRVSMHLVCRSLSDRYDLRLNPEVLAWFADGGRPESSPVERIKLHAVNKDGGEHGGCLVLETGGYNAATGLMTFTASGEDVRYFIEEYTQEIVNPLYYLSVHFSGKKGFFGGVAYGLGSPWCFPASCKKSVAGAYGIRRGFGFGAPGNEYPYFDSLMNIPEYAEETGV
jgi:hypothetical protein